MKNSTRIKIQKAVQVISLASVFWLWASVMEMDMELEMSLLSANSTLAAHVDTRPEPARRVQTAQILNERNRNEKYQGKFSAQR